MNIGARGRRERRIKGHVQRADAHSAAPERVPDAGAEKLDRAGLRDALSDAVPASAMTTHDQVDHRVGVLVLALLKHGGVVLEREPQRARDRVAQEACGPAVAGVERRGEHEGRVRSSVRPVARPGTAGRASRTARTNLSVVPSRPYTPEDPAAAGEAGLFARFGEERARVLRRRLIFYCVAGMVLLVVSAAGHVIDWMDATPEDRPIVRARLPWEALHDGLLWLIFGGTLASVLLRLPTRRGVVGQAQRLTAGACVVSLVCEGVTSHMATDVVRGQMTPYEAAGWASFTAISAVAVLFWLAMVLIPMRWRESGVVASVVMLGAAAALPFTIKADPAQSVLAALALVGVLGVGIAWSQWRYSAMDAKFQADRMRERLAEISGELAYARRVHEALFPPPVQHGSVRVRYRYEPMREIGGDFLYVHPESLAGKGLVPITVVVIDVSGHGVPAALTVSRLHGELQRFFGVHPGASPGELIANLNTFAYHAMAPHGMYATAIAVQIDPVMREIRYANAGHPPAVLRLADGVVQDMPATATMLGVLDRQEFDAGEVHIAAPRGASVLAYTDGAFEAMNQAREQFSLQRVKEIGSAPVGDRSKVLVERVAEFRRGQAQDDLLAVEIAWGEGETLMRRPATGVTRLTRILTGGGTKG